MVEEASIAITFLLGVGAGALGYLISRLITPRRRYPLKVRRFEAGNPPHGRSRGMFVMQYYAYLIVFLTIEPIVIYLFMIIVNVVSSPFSLWPFAILILTLIPPLIFGLNEARKVRLWILGKEGY
ncbi:TPA: hypothetical protein EYP26_04315 [Candidatus Bathyarchaeota archaeon]|nr:hypothetical protein [Candidatus Bathyarchaeota archaeon]